MTRIVLSVVAFLAFTAYTLFVVTNHSLFGFIADHQRGGWSLQIFIDLVVAATCFWVLAARDARARGITHWPYAVLTLPLGSIAILAYFVHRSLREKV